MPDVAAASRAGPSKERVSSYLYVGSIYFFTVAVLYSWGYWSTFGVNILEYISLGEVLKLTAYPIISTFLIVAFGAVLGELHLGQLPAGGGRGTRVGLFVSRHKAFIEGTYVVGTILLFEFGSVRKWLVLPVLLAIPISIALKPKLVLRGLLPSDRIRSVVIFLLTVMPTYAYGQGRLRADAVLERTGYVYLAANTVDDVEVADPHDSKSRVKYLGQVGDYVFLLLPDGTTTVVVRFDKTRGLHLRRFPEGANGQFPLTVY